MKKVFMFIIAGLLLVGCINQSRSVTFVPVAEVEFGRLQEGDRIIQVLGLHGISAHWEGEATKRFPVLVPRDCRGISIAILETNDFVKTEGVTLIRGGARDVER